MKTDPMSVALNLAAAMSLLSSSALRGATSAKAKALRLHLREISRASDIDAELRAMATSLLEQWEAVDCHHASRPVDHGPILVWSDTTH